MSDSRTRTKYIIIQNISIFTVYVDILYFVRGRLVELSARGHKQANSICLYDSLTFRDFDI